MTAGGSNVTISIPPAGNPKEKEIEEEVETGLASFLKRSAKKDSTPTLRKFVYDL